MKLKPLVKMMAMLPVVLFPATATLQASDLSIYKGNTQGKTSILLMLDTSGSMGISSLVMPKINPYGSPGDVDTALCDRVRVPEYNNTRTSTTEFYQWAYNLKDPQTNKTAIRKTVTIGGAVIPYYVRGCTKGGVSQYDRLSRLKDAILPLLASTDLKDEIVMGLGQFSSKTELTIGSLTNRLTDGHSGRIIVPNAALSAAQRIKIAQKIAEIKSLDTTTDEDGTPNANLKLSSNSYPNVTKASSGTPTIHAYAEAGAYMMGTVTGTGGVNSGIVDVIYDGYMVMQNGTEQVYFICVEEDPLANTNTLGATVKQCGNNWPGYDSTNKTLSAGNLTGIGNNSVYKPDGAGGWTKVVGQIAFKEAVGEMKTAWETFTKLPEGWRYGGWMKVNNEPLDIEPIVGTVWGGYAGGASGIVSYRTNPFSNKSQVVAKTVTTQGFQNCPTGYTPASGWISLCVKSGTFSRPATSSEITKRACAQPGDGSIDPLPNARNPQGQIQEEHYNQTRTSYNANNKTCVQNGSAVIRPWGDVRQTVNEVVPIDSTGGFAYSVDEAKNGDVYRAGGSTNSCDGNGIYFLTDGAPNSTKDTMAQTIVNNTLNNNSTYAFSSKPSGAGTLISPALKSGLFAGETGGWEYIGEYAKKLRNRTKNSFTQKNPLDMNIRTAVVGFGSSFAGLTKDLEGNYNCESAPNVDAKNACLWGSAAYGDGGFYYAENAQDIKESIIDFVDDLGSALTNPSTLGSISVPLDPLDQTRLMKEGFFPMIQPVEGNAARTWAGNLKKYYIVSGTLKDVNKNAIYSVVEGRQTLSTSAKDIWSAMTGDNVNHSEISSGGAWGKIPTPSLLDADKPSVRNVFTIDGTTLKAVRKENLATDYSGTDTLPALDNANIDLQRRYALLNYLGYKVAYPTTATTLTTEDMTALTSTLPQVPYRFLGGVVHSTPLVVTEKATLDADSEAVTSRTEYVVYGSMEGGLHIVDANTGEEKSVFIPKEILTNQPETLAQSDQNASLGLAYGVDAPWTADNTFKVQTTAVGEVETTKYVATKMNIYGGLRMGGKAIYGLDILNPSNPELLFHINDSTVGFGRLGQIWSKPTLAEMRVNGVRQQVLIFGGGYDETVYEKEAGQFVEPTTATKGNALYIVNAKTGTLIKTISSSNSGATGDQAEVKYSVVGQPVVQDYDGDNLADMIYFADLGGQIFRVDLNNAAQVSGTTDDVMVRVKRIANLRETNFVPRFYTRLTTAVFDEGQDRLVLVTAGSGNRSYPLESSKQPDKIYGILDYDASKTGLERSNFTNFSALAVPSNLAKRGTLGRTSTTIAWGGGSINDDKFKAAMSSTGNLRGWTFDILSLGDKSAENYAKSFDDSQLITGDLYVNVYDPKATVNGTTDACGGGVQGVSTTHRICAPFATCAAYVKNSSEGIIPPIFGSADDGNKKGLVLPIPGTEEACIGDCGEDHQNSILKDKGGYNYSLSRKVQLTRWFEK